MGACSSARRVDDEGLLHFESPHSAPRAAESSGVVPRPDAAVGAARPSKHVLVASGAGLNAANGHYVEDGTYKGFPRYVHEQGQLWLIRYQLKVNAWWYIADKDNLDVNKGDLYRIQSAASEPPLDCLWTVAHDGVAPGPILSELGKDGEQLVYEPGERPRSLDDYQQVDAISSILRSGDIVLLRASYILELHRTGHVLPRRQDLPPHAIVGKAMLERVLTEVETVCRCKRNHEMQFQGLVIVSYAWAAKEHPDSDGKMVADVLAPAIEHYMSERAAFLLNDGCRGTRSLTENAWWRNETYYKGKALDAASADFGLFLDYGSLYQHPRTPQEDAAFRRALNTMDVLYAHRAAVVWMLTRQLNPNQGLSYSERGWPCFESAIASLAKPRFRVLDLGSQASLPTLFQAPLAPWGWDDPAGQFVRLESRPPIHFTGAAKPLAELAKQASYVNCFQPGVLGGMLGTRPPPAVPSHFSQVVRSKTFTNQADVEAVIALQRRVAEAVLRGMTTMQFDTMGWTVSDVPALVEALKMATGLVTLHLEYNRLADPGATVLATALATEQCTAQLVNFSVASNKIGGAGIEALVQVWADTALMPRLKSVSLQNNLPLGAQGEAAVARLRKARPSVVVRS